jgi:hypothetical protein
MLKICWNGVKLLIHMLSMKVKNIHNLKLYIQHNVLYFNEMHIQWNVGSRTYFAPGGRSSPEIFVNRNYVYWAKVTSNWRSPADTPSLSPTVVAGLRVRYSRHRSSPETFFVRKICSLTDLFVMRGVRQPRFDCIQVIRPHNSMY